VSVLLLCTLPLAAQDHSLKPTVNTATVSGVTPPLRELARLPQPAQYGFKEANPVRRIAKRNFGRSVDPVEQRGAAPASNYSILANFLGVGNGFPGYTVPDAPPDTNMAVGDNQILQWVNVSYTICSKTSPYPCGPAIPGNTLWAAGIPGTLCANNNDGDILAQFDRAADRWLLSQNVFVSPYATCVAISDTNDANGTWHVWQFSVPGNGFPDYPKIGVWPTGYFQAQNNFGPGGSGFLGPQVCAYDRTAMLAGAPNPTQICFQLTASEDSLLPGDRDSPTPPPAGQDEFYVGSVGDVDNSHLSVYSFHADFVNPPNSFVTGSGNSQLVSIATFTPACNGAYGGDCVPQLGTSALLDSLGDRLMYRFAYYNDNATYPVSRQHWYVNFDVTASGGQNGVRWMEFATPQTVVSPTNLTILQQGTYAPDGNWRWMGSMARDESNDVLVGYSESNTNLYPSIFVAGRTAIDTLGTLENELAVVNGRGSQPDTSNRWGDYSAMRIDPVDNCTFWYTTEYYMVTQRFDWSTQIASVKFSDCPVTSLSSFEAWNRTGSPADEFKEFLGGVDPSSVTGTFNGDYPNVTITGLNGGTLIDWTGGATPDGTYSRFGISFSGNVSMLDATTVWYDGGSQVGPEGIAANQCWAYVVQSDGSKELEDCIPGGSGGNPLMFPTYLVQRRVDIVEDSPMPSDLGLGDLFRGGTLWNNATVIDPDFLLVSRTIRALLYLYPPLSPGGWDVMMYDVLDENRQLIMTYGNAINRP
jgi:hypothetical protein